jgi:hypothetical protein
MTSKRTLLAVGRDADAALAHVTDEIVRMGHKVVWLSEPILMTVFGLPPGLNLYEVRAVVRFAA